MEILGVEVYKVSGFVITGFPDMLVIGVFVLALHIQQDFLEFLLDLLEIGEELVSLWNLFSESQFQNRGRFIAMEGLEGGNVRVLDGMVV